MANPDSQAAAPTPLPDELKELLARLGSMTPDELYFTSSNLPLMNIPEEYQFMLMHELYHAMKGARVDATMKDNPGLTMGEALRLMDAEDLAMLSSARFIAGEAMAEHAKAREGASQEAPEEESVKPTRMGAAIPGQKDLPVGKSGGFGQPKP